MDKATANCNVWLRFLAAKNQCTTGNNSEKGPEFIIDNIFFGVA
ncbi:hypothetical protein ACM26S_00895 [Kluyvera sichuanensis]